MARDYIGQVRGGDWYKGRMRRGICARVGERDHYAMDVTYLFARLCVTDRDRAAGWYERLFGRPPDFLPNEEEAVWQVAETASVYLLAVPKRAGNGFVMLVVPDLEAAIEELAGRGIEAGPIEEIGGAGRRCTVTDPDGNVVSLTEIFGG